MKKLNKIMQLMPTEWRYRWCSNKLCACLGCANISGALQKHGFNKSDWEKWVKNNPKLKQEVNHR